MKITVIGPGAMGLLFGGKLAACADVSLIGRNAAFMKEINEKGVTIIFLYAILMSVSDFFTPF